jgi:hypothetical protein
MRRTHVAALPAAVSAVLLAPLLPAHAATSGRELDLRFESGAQRVSAGAAALTVRTVTHNGGTVATTEGRDGGAVRFPAFRSSSPPLAALAVTDRDGADDLAPGAARFRFGADFALDPTSQGSKVDNGNNLLQRGLWGHPMQYKLELDGKRPLCRVKGASGAVSVRSSVTVAADSWYRAVCERNGSTVTLTVTELGSGTSSTSSASGATGQMRPSSASVPLSVGAKLDAGGRLVTGASDQFNGKVDNAFVDVS